jgi:hypothetical protein
MNSETHSNPERRSLSGYDPISKEALRNLWTSGTFFLDANVLLNLYRYPAEARADLLRVLGHLRERLHVPFQAALEFERNRLSVIADQTKRFREVRSVVDSAVGSLRGQLESLQLRRRHSSINPEAFLTTVERAAVDFSKELDELEKSQLVAGQRDEIREYVYSLLGSRIGEPPPDQDGLDRLYAEGSKRYARKMPPGYMDIEKGDLSVFDYGGLTYKRQFGDLLLWEQVIGSCVQHGIKHAVLVTDDDKEDWWWMIESKGTKRIGPRPELVEEICRRSGVVAFHMYNSEQLVRWSSSFLDLSVQNSSIAQIRDVRQVDQSAVLNRAIRAEDAVVAWLVRNDADATIERELGGFPDVVVTRSDGRKFGYEIVAPRHHSLLLQRIRDVSLRAHYLISKRAVDEFWIVVVGVEPDVVKRVRSTITRREGSELLYHVGFIVGFVESNASGAESFTIESVSTAQARIEEFGEALEQQSSGEPPA